MRYERQICWILGHFCAFVYNQSAYLNINYNFRQYIVMCYNFCTSSNQVNLTNKIYDVISQERQKKPNWKPPCLLSQVMNLIYNPVLLQVNYYDCSEDIKV